MAPDEPGNLIMAALHAASNRPTAAYPATVAGGVLARAGGVPTGLTTLRAAETDPFALIGVIRRFDRETELFAEGETAEAVYKVVEGTIRLHKLLPDGRRQVIGFLQAGDMMGLSMAGNYLYTAECVTAAAVRRIPRNRFEAMMDEQPALARKLLTTMASELVAAQDQMLLLGRKTAVEKLASFLLALGRRAAARNPGCRRIDLPMSRTDIADYLGLTTETVSRGFTKLKTSRLIRLLDGNAVELIEPEALAELADCGA